ncbi:hypothetical protein BCEN4_740132 [Burkholderia cenocepacia]|nr:hypothetical protein BCEN4_740132 [Burkholderia cenocepacia]
MRQLKPELVKHDSLFQNKKQLRNF